MTTVKTRILLMTLLSMSMLAVSTFADDMSDPTNMAYIVSPTNGAIVSSPVRIVFGLRSPLGVAPAGFQMEGTGHHHLVIDRPLPDLSRPIPKDEYHRHFGGGQTETTIELTPGTHTLQLLLGDFKHVPHATPIASEQITIEIR